MLGQDVFCYPDLNLIVATHAGNDDVFQQSAMSRTIHDLVREAEGFSDRALPEDKSANASLAALVRSLEGEHTALPVKSGWKRRGAGKAHTVNVYEAFVKESLNGAAYDAEIRNIGLMPLIMQMVHNNFSEGIRRIAFYTDCSDTLHLEVTEGLAVYDIPLSFDKAGTQTRLTFREEPYDVRAIARAYATERGGVALAVRIVFLEEAADRLIEIYFDDTFVSASRIATLPRTAPAYLVAVFDENPGARMMTEAIRHKTKEDQGVVMATLDSAGAIDAFNERMESTIRPSTRLRRLT